jgi:dienelactone hydrolase
VQAVLRASVYVLLCGQALFESVRGADALVLWPNKISSIQQWEQSVRPEILRRMQEVMGPFPGPEKRGELDARVEEEVDCGPYIRRFLTYQSEPGSRVPAYLLIPKTVLENQARAPAVLGLHQTHRLGQKVVVGLGDSPNDEYGVELVKRGFVCVAPAYPLLANYAPELKKLGYVSGTMKAIWDNVRAIDLLETLPYVQKGSFAAIGHSLGGHNSLFTATFDPRIKVVVTSCGFDSFRDYMDGKIGGWTSERYMPRLAEYAAADRPFDFQHVLAALAPKSIFVSAPIRDSNFKAASVDQVCAAARPIFELYGAESRLIVRHPDVEHSFPKEMREESYRLIEKVLKR